MKVRNRKRRERTSLGLFSGTQASSYNATTQRRPQIQMCDTWFSHAVSVAFYIKSLSWVKAVVATGALERVQEKAR